MVTTAVIVAVGGAGFRIVGDATSRAEQTHREDRVALQRALGSLTEAYLLSAAKEAFDAASTGSWALTPGSPADHERLVALTRSSSLLRDGAALVTLDQKPLSAAPSADALPPAADAGYAPLVRSLLAGQPGLSSVMHVGKVPLVAVGVPVLRAGTAQAVLVAFFRPDTSPMQTYTERLRIGPRGRTYILDSSGTIVTATQRADVGKRVFPADAIAAVLAGRTGFADYDDHVMAFHPARIGGWATLSTQPTGDFYGPMRAGARRIRLLLIGLLAGASLALGAFNTRRERAMDRAGHQARHDALTGLPNRVELFDRLRDALSAASRDGGRVGVLFIDLDRFKVVNDLLGHDAGDAVLRAATGRIRACLRDSDVLARMGGDEFTVLLAPGSATTDAVRVAQRVLDRLSVPVEVDGARVYVGASIGIAEDVGGSRTADELLRDADLAMYRAKERGKARYELFDPSFGDAARQRITLEGELRGAAERGELLLHWLPVFSFERHEIVGLEALVRWDHPARGLLNPQAFLPLAEDTGAVVEIGEWVAREAVRQARRWIDAYPHRLLRVGINVSSRELLLHDRFTTALTAALAEHEVDPATITLELSERSVSDDRHDLTAVIAHLRSLGVRIAVDNFGAGHLAVRALRDLRVDGVKLDGSVVRGLETSATDGAIARAVIGLAHSLGMSVTAEAVETHAQLGILREMGCDHGQGALFGLAVAASDLTPVLTAGSALRLA